MRDSPDGLRRLVRSASGRFEPSRRWFGPDRLLNPFSVSRPTLVADSRVTVFFENFWRGLIGEGDQLISIVAETEQNSNGGNSSLESRAQISDESQR
jgi:hypothetical protein